MRRASAFDTRTIVVSCLKALCLGKSRREFRTRKQNESKNDFRVGKKILPLNKNRYYGPIHLIATPSLYFSQHFKTIKITTSFWKQMSCIFSLENQSYGKKSGNSLAKLPSPNLPLHSEVVHILLTPPLITLTSFDN